jgi:2,3-bisphosphoglycerate-dependent phosphoglycerate mutase
MRIFLVRHGESMGNVDKTVHARIPDHAIPLSPAGLVQAQDAGRFVANWYRARREGPPARIRIWTSPYERARQTARAVQAALAGLPVDCREHINLCEQQFGLFDGVPDADLPSVFPREHAHYAKHVAYAGRFWARMPLGESRFDVAVRIHQALGTFHRDAERHGLHDLVVICHGVSLRAFVMQWLHLTPEWFDRERNPGNGWVRLLEDERDLGYVYPAPAGGGVARSGQ